MDLRSTTAAGSLPFSCCSGIMLMCMVAYCSDYTVRLLITMGKKVSAVIVSSDISRCYGLACYSSAASLYKG